MTQNDSLLQAFLSSDDPDRTLLGQVASAIDHLRQRLINGEVTAGPRPGEALKLFLAGYAGAGNTGADIRVLEMIRQFQHLFRRKVRITLSVIDSSLPLGPDEHFAKREITYLPTFLLESISDSHGSVACEGSMFKSNFCDALSLMMLGALGLGLAGRKVAIGYGADAGQMSSGLETFARSYCQDALIFCRSQSSRDRIARLGLRTASGTDTAWTFEPESVAASSPKLQACGWDCKTPVLAICPVNPFWWPVRADPSRYEALLREGRTDDFHYGFVYFYNNNPEAAQKYRAYLASLAAAVGRFCRERRAFPVVIGMDRVDRTACNDLANLLPAKTPIFASPDFLPADRAAILRLSSFLVSSRFHAIVLGMPAGIPAIGLTYDERIDSLFAESGCPELLIQVDDPELEEKLWQRLLFLETESERISESFARLTSRHLKKLGMMGAGFVEEVCAVYPDFERPNLGVGWEAHLPSLSPHLEALLNRFPPDERV
jgi:polysaccharide pyruvyl transferase WcaK-like protein